MENKIYTDENNVDYYASYKKNKTYYSIDDNVKLKNKRYMTIHSIFKQDDIDMISGSYYIPLSEACERFDLDVNMIKTNDETIEMVLCEDEPMEALACDIISNIHMIYVNEDADETFDRCFKIHLVHLQ